MKKKILLLTNIYPEPGVKLLNTTDVCHYFSKEWVEMGYEVKVIYNYHIYAKLLHFIAKFFEKIIANSALSVVNLHRVTEDKKYVLDGVSVNKFPLFKVFPRTKFPKKSIDKQIEKILKSNNEENFEPDLILGHFHNPNLELINLLRQSYNAKTSLVLHGDTSNIEEFYKENSSILLDNIDLWGYRSRAIGVRFEEMYGARSKSFICYSGVPKSLIANYKVKRHTDTIRKFIYVGTLIKRKYPSTIVSALSLAYPNKDFSLIFIGNGTQKRKIIKTIGDLNVIPNVKFLTYLPREQVSKEIEKSDCFIMISKNESFGLVYLEAMAKGCITVGSRNEGIDGVIKDGENGFLCEAGNYKELAEIIKKINTLSIVDKNKISQNAIETAKSLTDNNVAKNYLDTVLNL